MGWGRVGLIYSIKVHVRGGGGGGALPGGGTSYHLSHANVYCKGTPLTYYMKQEIVPLSYNDPFEYRPVQAKKNVDCWDS